MWYTIINYQHCYCLFSQQKNKHSIPKTAFYPQKVVHEIITSSSPQNHWIDTVSIQKSYIHLLQCSLRWSSFNTENERTKLIINGTFLCTFILTFIDSQKKIHLMLRIK